MTGSGGAGGGTPNPPRADAARPVDTASPSPPPDAAPPQKLDVSAGGPPVMCGDIPAWMADVKYADGAKVANGSPPKIYQCLPWPRSGWCPISAYEPGKPRGPWMDAWMEVGPCP